MDKVKNAKTHPQVYFGLHMVEGLAEYKEPQVNNGEPYRILVSERTIKNMDTTFQGKPVYVNHVDGVDLENLQSEADGYVIRSFFNKADGKHWAEFIVVSDRGHEAIRAGWKLSNAYIPKAPFAGGGQWHGVDYVKEILNGEYEHLAIVRNPRYQESVILTPEQFKQYNHDREIELTKLANSKEIKGVKSMFEFFKKAKVENGVDLESHSVVLPKSRKEVALIKLINDMDEMEMNSGKPQMCNGEHRVKVGDEEMSVNELVEKHCALKASMEKPAKDMPNESDEEAKKKALQLAEHEEKEIEEAKKKSAADEGKDEKEGVKKNALEMFEKLKNAPNKPIKIENGFDFSEDKVARGKARYGSK